MGIDAAKLERAYDLVEAAAIAGTRCPQNDQLPIAGALPALARAGRVRIEISNKNWRVVEILKGPHKGRRTLEPPGGKKPWKIIDADTRINGRVVGAPQSQPSAPRVLTRDEL